MHLGRAHKAGEAVVWVPDQEVKSTREIVESRAACYGRDGHFGDWEETLAAIPSFDPQSIAPCRGG